eukprot:GDKI01026829.1.p1 GENE.GDKI01026829.1~~GDKI01026829.1.p1  ORF type:complete len:302 (-),score=74.03 GDKI01026829.1:133-1038(-)
MSLLSSPGRRAIALPAAIGTPLLRSMGIGSLCMTRCFSSTVATSNLDPTQVALMQERVILVDRDDHVLGDASKEETHLTATGPLLHRAFSVFLFNREGKVLMQQRASEKITFPDYWTNTCCSHPLYSKKELGLDTNDAVAGVKRAAVRKLQHELGVSLAESTLNYVCRLHYLSASDGKWGEHEIDYVLLGCVDEHKVPVCPNANEVRATKYVSSGELKEMMHRDDSGMLKLTPWSRLIMDRFLFDWWRAFDKSVSPAERQHMLTQFRERDGKVIHRLGSNADRLQKWEVQLPADRAVATPV